MINRWIKAAAITAFSLIGCSGWAATFTQTNVIDPGQVAQIAVDLDFASAGFELGGWQMTITPAPLTAFVGVQDFADGPADPNRSPLYQVLAGSPIGTTVFGATAETLTTSPLLTPFTLLATSRNLPVDNLSRFTLGFLTATSLPTNASYDISYVLSMSVRETATGIVTSTAFAESGSFQLTVGAISVVPLPASGALLAGAMVAGWGLRRRRSAR